MPMGDLKAKKSLRLSQGVQRVRGRSKRASGAAISAVSTGRIPIRTAWVNTGAVLAAALPFACGSTDVEKQEKTAVNIAAISAGSANLRLQQLTAACVANQVQDFFNVTNNGTALVAVSDITIKLWVDDTSAANLVGQVNYGGCLLDAAGSCVHQVTGVTATATKFSPACGPDPNHQANWEVTITSTDHSALGAGLTWSNIQSAVHLTNYANFNPGTSEWYSPCLSGSSFKDSSYFAVYVQGNLVTSSTGVPPACRAVRGTQPLAGEIPPGVSDTFLVGALPGTTQLSVGISLPLRNQADLQTLLQQLYDPKNKKYRKYIDPTTFGNSYGVSSTDYQKVVTFAQARGLTVRNQYPSRNFLVVSGTAASVESAFRVTLNNYQRADGTVFFAPANEPSLDLDVPVMHLTGLDNWAIMHRQVPGGGTGPAGYCRPNQAANAFWGNDFRNVYFPNCGLNASGQTIGLFESALYYDTDITSYITATGIATPPSITPVSVGTPVRDFVQGFPNACPADPYAIAVPNNCGASITVHPGVGDEIEVALDIEMVISMAPGAAVRVYETSDTGSFGAIETIQAMLNEPASTRPSVASSSWMWDNGTYDPAVADAFLQAAVTGLSIVWCSGDWGAYVEGGAHSVPESPLNDTSLITVVGGTALSTTGSGSSIKYGSESVWNDSAADVALDPNCSLSTCQGLSCGCKDTSSGGVCSGYTLCTTAAGVIVAQPPGTQSGNGLTCASSSYPNLPIPSYQQNLPAYLTSAAGSALSTTTRMIPDVSMVADQLAIFALDTVPDSTTNGGLFVLDPVEQCGFGTSAAAPLWAGVIALANHQQALLQQPPLGFVNPALYTLAAASKSSYSDSTGAFHDVTVGSNVYSGSTATTSYQAVQGYDLATGLGSPNGLNNCNPINVLPPQSCMPGSALSALVMGNNVVAFMPNGSWSDMADTNKGISVVPIEGSLVATQIPTAGVINTCSGNSLTGNVVCTDNGTGVYVIDGKSLIQGGSANVQTLTSSANTYEDFSGGGCETCNVSMDPLHNRAYLSIGYGSGAAFQSLDLSQNPPVLGTPIPTGQQATTEDVVVDTLRGFILSPNEGFENSASASVGDFQLINTSTQQVFDYINPPGVAQPGSPDLCSGLPFPGGFDGVAEDCTTGIAVATVEFTDQLYLVDLTQATFNTDQKTWSPNGSGSFISIPEVRPYMCSVGAGTDGAAIAPNSHLGVITGEFGDNHFVVIKLPSISGSGTPTLKYAFAPIPNTPDGRPWVHGKDPHTVTAYTSAGIQRAFAIVEDDAFSNGTRTYLAVIDLQAVLDARPSGSNTVASLSWCLGNGPNPSGCPVRFVKVGVNAVGPSAALASPLP